MAQRGTCPVRRPAPGFATAKRPRRRRQELMAILVVLCVAGWLPAMVAAAEPPSQPLRIGFTRVILGHVNQTDAEAALTVWAASVARERDLNVEPISTVHDDLDEVIDALRRKRLDAINLTFLEYLQVAAEVVLEPIFLVTVAGAFTDEYLLLVERESAHDSLAGRSLTVTDEARMCLAADWLDLLASETGYPGGARAWLGDVRSQKTASSPVMGVFFGTADAAVTTSTNFDTMRELNPQIGRKLRVVARSRALVTTMTAFRKDFESPDKERIFAALNDLHTSSAGQQVLMLFKCDGYVQVDAAVLEETRAFVSRVRSLRHGLSARSDTPPTAVTQQEAP